MGGFRVNGCGTKDYFTKMKYLGERLCPQCKKMTPFYLEKAKQKISVLYIPTVTLKERYAIMCEKCGTGHFIDEAQMHQIMAGAVENAETKETENTSSVIEKSLQEDDAAGNHEEIMVHTCPNCGVSGTGTFCSHCGTKYEEISKDAEESIRYCPNCGAKMTGPFCGICGTKYEGSTDVMKDNINIIHSSDINQNKKIDTSSKISGKLSDDAVEKKDVMWECELCGTRNDSSTSRCSLCGFERKK